MKWLEDLLNEVEGKESLIKDIKTNLAKDFVPKSEFNAKNDEVKELKEQVSERDTQLTELKESAKGNEDLTKKIEELESENKTTKEEYESKISNLKKSQLASKILLDHKAKNIDVNMALFNLDEFELNEDGSELVGFKDKVEEHKKEFDYLYSENSGSYNGFKPTEGSDGGSDNGNKSVGAMFGKQRNESKVPKNTLWD